MSRASSYGDEITLRVIVNVCGVRLKIVSTLGQYGMADITLDTLLRGLIAIGRFDEANGIHYVVLNEENVSRDPIGIDVKHRDATLTDPRIMNVVALDESCA